MSMKNFNDTIGNQTCDLLACSGVPQPTVPLRTPLELIPYSLYNDFTVLHHNHLASNAPTEGMVRTASLVKTAFTVPYHHSVFTSALSVLLLIPPLSCLPVLMLKIFCATRSLLTKEAV